MLFHSPTFLVFLAVFLSGLWVFRGEARIVYTCLASYVFYGWWYPPYLFVLLGLTAYAYIFTRFQRIPRAWLFPVIALGLLPLCVFKYTAFVLQNLSAVTGLEPFFHPDWALPLGISFVSFTVIAYVLDVRAGKYPPGGKLSHTALYISFFPQLIAGPVLRAHELMPQIGRIKVQPEKVKLALLLFSVGAMKKVGVADQLAPLVDRIYGSEQVLTSSESILAFYAFSIQIYCDFSGYTDMALALGLLLNVSLPENFERPYIAMSIREFWRRWHMTLSRWLRDYLYVPLGGSRQGIARTVAAITITMALGGLWHGAAWTFVLWGLFHGLLVAAEHVMEKCGVRPLPFPGWIKSLVVFHVVSLLWVFFRAPSLEQAWNLLHGFCVSGSLDALSMAPLAPVLVVAVIALHPLDNLAKVRGLADRLPISVVSPLALMVIVICAALSVNNPSTFIYFDF
jgi:alginate O-acetyltransferase complex protein AlgI